MDYTLTELLQIAYKKLKSYVFFDKTLLPLRDKIVLFEGEDDLYGVFQRVSAEINSVCNENSKHGNIVNNILDGIDCYIFPKEISFEQYENKGEIIFSNIRHDVSVERSQYLIDMDVMGHVLGILWIMLVGCKIDKDGYENSYGNRIKKNYDASGPSLYSYSPYLFEPYFSQYESWRDNGLNQAKKLLDNNKNAVMLTLDLSRFFYSVDIDKTVLDDVAKGYIGDDIERTELIMYLNEFIFDVFKRYSDKLRSYEEELVGDRIVLPIGFAPSSIISNLCLKKFDDAMIKGWNPTYYGRYVDDMLIVDKVEENSPLLGLIKENKPASEIIEYLLCFCDAWRRDDCSCSNSYKCGLFYADDGNDDKDNNAAYEKKECADCPKNKQEEKPKEYLINGEFLTFPKSKIKLQGQKVKMFYFDSSQSDALIKCFQKNIQNNVSEFRYLPEDEPIFSANDYTEIYKLTEKDSPNKLNEIIELGLDKFKFSKFLGKYTRISGLVNDDKESLFYSDIEKIFTPSVTLANYTSWEKVLTILICNEKFDKVNTFIDLITSAITNLKLKNKEKGEKEGRCCDRLKESLFYFLRASVNRTLALVWGDKYKKAIDEISGKLKSFAGEIKKKEKNLKELSQMREMYCLSRMVDKYAMPLLIDEFIDEVSFLPKVVESDKKLKDDKKKNICVNLTSMSSALAFLSGRDIKAKDYLYYPYMITIMDLSISNMVQSLLAKDEETIAINCDIKKLKNKYTRINYSADGDEIVKTIEHNFYGTEISNMPCIKVGTGNRQKVKLAIGNAQLTENNLRKVLQHEFDRSYARYEDMVTIVNSSLKKKADMLVLPEGYLPISWLPIFARSCAKSQMAAIVGIEHFIVNNKVYNITAIILPYVVDDYKYAYIYFHKKTHYAPREKNMITDIGYSVAEGDSHPLFCWDNFWFSVYCCYELTSIKDRAIYQSYVDAVIMVEWNMDVNYYSNIIESLSRDLHCYCVQVNMAKYGDSRITQPTKTEGKDILRIKGGQNATVLIDEIDIRKLRNFQLLGTTDQQHSDEFKVVPPDFRRDKVLEKNKCELWDEIDKINKSSPINKKET